MFRIAEGLSLPAIAIRREIGRLLRQQVDVYRLQLAAREHSISRASSENWTILTAYSMAGRNH
jgi:hypothetical protein